ncbi:hypothetical protein L6255_04025 [Candidatus Parcubacteria bacterium]|nr:hypothetical protein [Patescibacteria group bacterium]MBU4380661.1 hypothetical protein [Patescibacteria group bacterium]MCG2689578.1 hypothetical protein [Candidatus Parcubacteria bacterium]
MEKKFLTFSLGDVKNNAIPNAVPQTGSNTYTGNIESIISVIIGTITIIAGVALLLYLAMGAFTYMTAGGDEKAATKAKGMITDAVIGLIIVVASMTIATILLKIFGLDIKALPWYS